MFSEGHDEQLNDTHGRDPLPQRMMVANHIRDPHTGKDGPWLAGMALQADVVSEALRHLRGSLRLIAEFGGRSIKAVESFSAAFVVGVFDSLGEIPTDYDTHGGLTALEGTEAVWQLVNQGESRREKRSAHFSLPDSFTRISPDSVGESPALADSRTAM